MDADDPRHGTYAGSQRHRLDGEAPCEPCRQAGAEYMREWRKEAKHDKARHNARARALWRLAKEYPGEYERLYIDEVRKALASPRPDAEVSRCR